MWVAQKIPKSKKSEASIKEQREYLYAHRTQCHHDVAHLGSYIDGMQVLNFKFPFS